MTIKNPSRRLYRVLVTACLLGTGVALAADGKRSFSADDVFELEWVRDPQIAPDGSHIVWVRTGYDRMSDRARGSLWITDVASGRSEPLITGTGSYRDASFSPDGSRLLYIASTPEKKELRVRWLASGRETRVALLENSPKQMVWSPDGERIAFTMFTPGDRLDLSREAPRKPDDANWADPVKVIDDLVFRFDGRGFLKKGDDQVYVVPAHGGTPRALTSGGDGFESPEWSADGATLYVVGNDVERPELDPIESEIYAVDVASGERTAITSRDGPDESPVASPDGTHLAWLGYDDKRLSHQQNEVHVRRLPDGEIRVLTNGYDHTLADIQWDSQSNAIHALANVEGELHLVEITLDGTVRTLVTDVGGTSLGRPYAAGDYAVLGSDRGRILAWTAGDTMHPPELAIRVGDADPRVVTDLNSDLLANIALPRIEELHVESRLDGLPIEAWMAIPDGVEADGTAPMILEIHGGPYAMYAPTFAAEIQRYAAEGYVTVWANPRGSTGYGEDFALEIDLAYPGPDHEDLMTVVDEVLERGWVNPERLFITGGSGGGVLSAYATGMTDRFAAAAVIKPVINWFTMALAGDIGMYVTRHWIRANPWEEPQKFFDLSPIRVVGNVTTPTLVMVGEEDWRTPTWEAEQWYTALQMRGVPTAYVRVPGASHSIASRPSRLVSKTDTIMAWFERHDPAGTPEAE
jgi:dipeptidyl aminopeptidase/acylaminoacyl peptidase